MKKNDLKIDDSVNVKNRILCPDLKELCIGGWQGRISEIAEDDDDNVTEYWDNILKLYKKFEDKKPIMLIDVQEKRVYAFPYLEFKSSINERSQAKLEKEYENALLNNKVVVFVQDHEKKQLLSQDFDLE